MAAWSCKTLKKSNFLRFLEKRPLTGKFSKCFERIHRDIRRPTCCVQISWNLADGKSVKSCVAYLTKNFAWLSSSCYCTDRAQNLPGSAPPMYSECSRFCPNRFTFGAVIPERMNTIKTGRKVFPTFGWSLASSRINSRPTAKRNTNIVTHADYPFWHSSMNDVTRFLGEIDSPSPLSHFVTNLGTPFQNDATSLRTPTSNCSQNYCNTNCTILMV